MKLINFTLQIIKTHTHTHSACFVILRMEGCPEGFVLFCVMCVIVLYCTVLYCTVLYCPVLQCSTLPSGINPFAVDDDDNNNNNNKGKGE